MTQTRTHDGGSQDIVSAIDYTQTTARVDAVTVAGDTSTVAYQDGGQSRTVSLAGVANDYTYNFEEDWRLQHVDAPEDVSVVVEIDPATRLVTEETNGGVTTSYTYDTQHRLSTETEPAFNGAVITTTYGYDGSSWDVASITRQSGAQPLPGDVTYDWQDGDLVEMVEDGGNGLILTTSYEPTAKHQVLTETAPDGTVTKYEYDSYGNRTATVANYVPGESATPSRNVRTEYAYDQSSRDGRAGLVTSETDPLGRVTTYDYDALGRLTRTIRNVDGGSSASDANLTSRTLYDELGFVEATIDERGTVTRLVTDRHGRVTTRIEHCTDSGTTPSPDTSDLRRRWHARQQDERRHRVRV